jgi:hypothetical protein
MKRFLLLTLLLFCSLTLFAQVVSASPAPTIPLAAKVATIAIAASSIIQVVKKFFPTIHGALLTALNLIAGLASAFATVDQAQMWSVPFILQVVVGTLASIGVYDFASLMGLFKGRTQLALEQGIASPHP